MLFAVAKHGYRLSDFLENPDGNGSRAHIPALISWEEPGPGDQVAMVQVNHFDCGGVAIGLIIYHKLADGTSMAAFTKSWAATARGCSDTVLPDYTQRSLFPPNETMQRDLHVSSAMTRYFGFGKTATRRYVFGAASISKLGDGLLAEPERANQLRPTRVETVSAFLWKCFMLASAASGSNHSTSLVSHVVNMRRRADPPLPDHSFGNYVWTAPASSSDGDLKALFGKVREAVSRVDVEFVKRMEGEMGFAGYCTNQEETKKGFVEKSDYLCMVSWCNLGFYEVDFGWGKPVWMSKCDGGSDVECPFLNMVWLIDTRERDGIEASVVLDEHLFAEFDKIKDLRDLALVDPSPLLIAGFKQSDGME